LTGLGLAGIFAAGLHSKGYFIFRIRVLKGLGFEEGAMPLPREFEFF